MDDNQVASARSESDYIIGVCCIFFLDRNRNSRVSTPSLFLPPPSPLLLLLLLLFLFLANRLTKILSGLGGFLCFLSMMLERVILDFAVHVTLIRQFFGMGVSSFH